MSSVATPPIAGPASRCDAEAVAPAAGAVPVPCPEGALSAAAEQPLPPLDLEDLMIPPPPEAAEHDIPVLDDAAQAVLVEEVDCLLAELGKENGEQPEEEDGGNSTVSTSAVAHFAKHVASCLCKEGSCIMRVRDAETLCKSLAKYNADERRLVVKSMLLTSSSGPNEPNDLVAAPERRMQRKRRGAARSAASEPTREPTALPSTAATSVEQAANKEAPQTTTVYALRGVRVCRSAFAAVVQLTPNTVSNFARVVAGGDGFDPPVDGTGKSRIGKYSQQRLMAVAFMHAYGHDNGLENPVGRWSKKNKPALVLPVGTTKRVVYDAYKDSWGDLKVGAMANADASTQSKLSNLVKPLAMTTFIDIWNADMSHLRIAHSGSDYCDTCVTLRNIMKRTGDSSSDVHRVTKEALEKHVSEATTEFLLYRRFQDMARGSSTHRHFVFDFAEKVLLPRLLKQPGQLHFTTGLKFDINGVSCSNTGNAYVFGLPEGHWPNEKSANSVISMLNYAMNLPNESRARGETLLLSADNCGGQNKNRFVLWYLAWLVCTGREKRVELDFMIPGHTKNVVDGRFGLVKRLVRRSDVVVPAEMMKIIQDSCDTTTCVPSVNVTWRDWKEYLQLYFGMPVDLKISQSYRFIFDCRFPGSVEVTTLSTSSTSQMFSLLRRGSEILRGDVDFTAKLNEPQYCLSWEKDLSKVKSAKHDTRMKYLEVGILDRYYQDNVALRSAFFEDGAKGLEG